MGSACGPSGRQPQEGVAAGRPRISVPGAGAATDVSAPEPAGAEPVAEPSRPRRPRPYPTAGRSTRDRPPAYAPTSPPHVLIIGGGGTGGALAHDLALRGLRVTLVERGEVTSGTTGRHHGLLHSGARYATTDRAAAVECIAENKILRRIAPGRSRRTTACSWP